MSRLLGVNLNLAKALYLFNRVNRVNSSNNNNKKGG